MSAGEQSTSALLAALLEHDPGLDEHVKAVVSLTSELGHAFNSIRKRSSTCGSLPRCTTSARSPSRRRSSTNRPASTRRNRRSYARTP